MSIGIPASLRGDDWWDDTENIEKLASSDLPLRFIEAVIKTAASQKEKKATDADFDAAGRILAHGYWDELTKLASAAAETPEPVTQVKEVDSKKLAAVKALLAIK